MPYRRGNNGYSYVKTNAPVDDKYVFETPEDDPYFGGYNAYGIPIQEHPIQTMIMSPIRAFHWLLTGHRL